ncbi:acetyl-CoA carboxylase biotin carboxylase subunit [Limosilactobacillus antri]|uniref:biotin carboxylase n=1 Tax=Limosilactobacillus antri DSM 16041 TaxID=525309 RepID=C8P651_9LACO|nr:acetyl-CoA carboxylase biotin carboxylase subunit [Limosilactobacillus antri]EEW54020.1 putative acetyl-CoA carboxylase, biotin carboxylase subunit [Limosilactobacillus antri DSM 16041]KRK57249.1 acetyl-CoA carboxylase [Limosilactobacillus antri DSM 16041]
MDNHLFKSSRSVSKWPFHKVLVANRGEIAVRIIRTCRLLGIKTVAVYSAADKTALHVKLADEAVCIGPASASKSYLNISAIIVAAKITGAGAIHPGYGFLSESPEFAAACEKNGLKLIGPSSQVIALLGDKEQARLTMAAAGLPVVKGSTQVITKVADALDQASQLGYPVMLKASAGGGGKGMRIVHSPAEMKANFPVAQEEAMASFSSKEMYLEQYLPNPRHIEVQIVADRYGNVTALGERDCTIQARHQKVIEEAPAAVLSDDVRAEMLKRTETAVSRLHYEGAGTIEFLYNRDGSFYFMEMNTRIQVEHPITELITGTDLVELQLRIAAGDELSKHHIKTRGFALECRVTALTPGKITGLHLPSGQGVRVDTALYQGYVVPGNYDGMIAKIIVYGDRRQQVLQQMQALVGETVIKGIKTNLEMLAQILQEPDFQRLTTNVNWLDKLEKRGPNANS